MERDVLDASGNGHAASAATTFPAGIDRATRDSLQSPGLAFTL